jgi:hypothetical protein
MAACKAVEGRTKSKERVTAEKIRVSEAFIIVTISDGGMFEIYDGRMFVVFVISQPNIQ